MKNSKMVIRMSTGIAWRQRLIVYLIMELARVYARATSPPGSSPS
jgi:hypothetical protein